MAEMSQETAPRRLAYLVSKFPTVTETFILREIMEVEAQGQPISLYTIRREHPSVVHEDARPYLDRLHIARPWALKTWRANLSAFMRNPFLYLSLIAMTIREDWSSKHLLVRDLFVFPKAVAFAQMMQAEGITHVHAHWATHTAYMAYIIHCLTGISYSFTAHAHDIYIRKAMLCRKVHHAAFVATISNFNREELIHDCGASVGNKIHIVRCGISPDRFKPRPLASRPEARPFTILTVASLRDYKGHPYAIEAAHLLKGRIDHFQWLVIGGGPDRTMLEKMIKDCDVEDVFRLLGPRSESDVQQMMQDADIFAMSSIMLSNRRMEGIPVSLMESLAVELPTVATRISGIPELVEDNITGRLVPERDPQALAEAIYDLYCHPEKARQLATAGRQRVLEEFTVADNASRLMKLFGEVSR